MTVTSGPDRAQSRQVFEAVHAAVHGDYRVGVVVQQATTACANVQEETLGEVRQRIIRAYRIENAEYFVGIHFSRSALPGPHGVLDLVKRVPRELTAARLMSSAPEEPLDDRDRDHDTDQLGSQVAQDRPGVRICAHVGR